MNEKLKKLLEQRAAAITAQRALLDKADEEKRDLTSEEEGTYQKYDSELDALDKKISRERSLIAREEEMRASENGDRNPQRDHQPGANGAEHRGNPTDSAEYRQAMLRYMIGGQMSDVLKTDPRGSEARTILGVSLTGTGATGGVLAPTELEKNLLAELADQNVVRGLADVRSSSSDVEIPYTASHTIAYMVDEGADFTASTPSFDKKTFGAHKAGALSYVTFEALADMFINTEAFIREDFGRAFAKLEEQQFIAGTGTKQPSGILTGGTSAFTSAGATAITADELIDLVYAVPAGYRKNGTFLMNDSTIKLIRKLKSSDQQYIWQPGLQAGQPDRLLGYAIATSDSMPAVAAGAKAVAFGDFKQYRILDRVGLYFQRLNEIAATSGQVGFLAYRRYDAKLLHADAIKFITQKAS